MTEEEYILAKFSIITMTVLIFAVAVLVKIGDEMAHERAMQPVHYSHRDATYQTTIKKGRLDHWEAITYGGAVGDEKITMCDRSGRKCVITLKENGKKIIRIHRNWDGRDTFHNR